MDEDYITISEYLWWLIFRKFNPLKLLKLRVMSSEFESAIEKYFEKNGIWKEVCQDNIDLWAYQILSKAHPNELINTERPLSSGEWKDIFFYYCKWRSSSTFTSLIAEIEYGPEEEITCTTVWRDFLIVGSKTTGRILLSDIEKEHNKIAIGFENKYAVKDLKVWLAEKDREVVVVLSQNKSLKFFDLTNQAEDALRTSLKYYAKNICVGVDHRLFAENNYRVTEYNFNGRKIQFHRTCDLSIFMNSPELGSKFLSMHSENDLLMVMIKYNDKVQIFEINFSRDIYEDPEMLNMKVIQINNIFKQNIIISLIPIKELGLIFCGNELIVCNNFSKSGKECKYFKLVDFKNDFITCAAMYTNIIFLGWNSGLFSKIYLNRLEDFINFNNPPHSRNDTFQLCTEPLIAINLAEYHSISYIIVTTKNIQYYITNHEIFEEIGSSKPDDNDDEELLDTSREDYDLPSKRPRLSY